MICSFVSADTSAILENDGGLFMVAGMTSILNVSLSVSSAGLPPLAVAVIVTVWGDPVVFVGLYVYVLPDILPTPTLL